MKCARTADKEAWEPTIQYLFLQKDSDTGKPLLREAWAFDMQSHGEASSLNAVQLKNLPVGLREYPGPLSSYMRPY